MIYKKKIILEPIDDNIDSLIDKIAKPIILFNKEHNWEDDNCDDILCELVNNYEIPETLDEIIEKINNYLHKR